MTTATTAPKKKIPWSKIALGVILVVLIGLQVFQFKISAMLLEKIQISQLQHEKLEIKQKIADDRLEVMILGDRLENQLQKDQ
ncbi:hypothetical protein SAMN02745664_102201 [Moraxella cuniculi DSM 21768]|uniref:Uncharacterized protein n=1 Tax=Moraxella cuniculi DSM 21768 TaxID=1122245 RepID=A0A1N7DX94_9GAMM|nr:hypothetical protein [Moraxella cuniculi]OOS07367.1 hypothetical protein B0189_02745 [Moraxella cuniculi]SIR80472.1 hypothetical protein SAMN02745664_102201 [Moraxella cuniculi DSM 21768]